ncbi:MAG: hypothetical protein II057_07305, partial [Clostridia bacterium]|nr:hypothetical protein [Clostridia bacterium]
MKRNVKMKILIAVVFTILILALIAGFFMNRRGNGEVRSAYDYTKVTTVTATKKAQKTTVKESGKTTKKAETKKADSGKAATTATTLKKSQRKITIPGAYVPIMNLSANYSHNWLTLDATFRYENFINDIDDHQTASHDKT